MSGRRSTFGDTDEGWGERKSRTSSDELDITPMIDVTFLLLIFFMVSSTMQPQIATNIPPATYGLGVENANSTVVYVSPAGADGGEASVRMDAGDGQLRETTLDEVRQKVQDGVAANRPHVVIKADADTTHAAVSEIAQIVTSVENAQLHFGVREKKRE